MSPNVAGSSNNILNIDEFIVDIENRPAIWNRNYHCNKPYLNQMWTELMEIHKLPIVVLKAKWKGLRDNFRVEYKRIPRNEKGEFLIPPEIHDSKWIYYYALLFLTDHMRHRQPRSEQETATVYLSNNFGDQDAVEQTLVEPDLSNGLIQIADSDDEFNEDDDDDYCSSVGINGSVSTSQIGKSIGSGSHGRCDDSQASVEDIPKSTVKLARQSLMEMMRTKEITENTQQKSINSNQKAVPAAIEKKIIRRTSTTNTSTTTNTTINSNSVRYANGFELSPKSKRPRLSEDSNFNGSSTMDMNLPDDDDYHYLLSLHPYMKQLTAAQKLRIRTKIQKLIFKELYKEDIEETK